MSTGPFNLRGNSREEENHLPNLKFLVLLARSQNGAPKKEEKPTSNQKGEKIVAKQSEKVTSSQAQRNIDIRCFRCHGICHISSQYPNKRAMILLENRDIVSKAESDKKFMPPLEDASDTEYAVVGQSLVVLRSLHVQAKEENNELQRENIFYTCCHVKQRVCGLILDGGSCVNVARKLMVDELGLKTQKHPHPYFLQWLNESGEM